MVFLVISMVLLGIVFPRAAKHLLFAPILGTCLGGFAWSMACIGWGMEVSLHTFSMFLGGGNILSQLLVAKM